MSYTLEELTEIFRRLGSVAPERWARPQIEQGVPQLHRFLFLKAAQSHILRPDDTRWVKHTLKSGEEHPDSPEGPAAPALRRMLEKGVDPRDVAAVVRAAQYELLFDFCQLLDDSEVIHTLPREGDMPEIGWGLFTVDEEGNPGEPIDALIESVSQGEPL